MPTLSPPPADLRGFPRRTLRTGADLFRVHPRAHGPWWFSSDGNGRFDLPAPSGTCYLALSALGAFDEVFRGFTLVAADDIASRRLSIVRCLNDAVLADCTSSRARRFGVTAAIHNTPDYTITQAWAVALEGRGFEGVRYFCGHDPSQREVGIALFGWQGEASWSVEDTGAITEAVIRSIERRYGIHVLPAP